MAKMPPHSKPVEFLYRSGYAVQAVGFLVLLASANPSSFNLILTIAGYALIDLGIFISGILLQVYDRRVKIIILSAYFIGLALQKIGFLAGLWWLGPLGLGIAFIAAAGLGGKEAYCFAINEGWLMTPLLAILAITLFVHGFKPMPLIFLRLIIAVVALDYVSFSIKKFRKPFLSGCEKS